MKIRSKIKCIKMSINKMHIWIELLCKEKEYAWKKRNDQIFFSLQSWHHGYIERKRERYIQQMKIDEFKKIISNVKIQ